MSKVIKTFVAGGAIGHRRLVKIGAADGVVLQASAAADAIVGVVDSPGGVATGDRVDVVLFGFADLEFGGTVARGTFVVSDADGKGVAAAPASGANVAVIGRTFITAASGDVLPVLVNPGQIQGA